MRELQIKHIYTFPIFDLPFSSKIVVVCLFVNLAIQCLHKQDKGV